MVSVTADGNWHLFVLWLVVLSVLLYQNIYIHTPDQDLGHGNSFNRASNFGTGLSIPNSSGCFYKIKLKMLSSLLLKRSYSGKLPHTLHRTQDFSIIICVALWVFRDRKIHYYFDVNPCYRIWVSSSSWKKNSATASMKIQHESNEGDIFQLFPMLVPQGTSQISRIAVLA